MRLFILLFLMCLHFAALAAAPRVVTSIAPVYEITATVMAGVAEPELIIDDSASAHHFAFKPSHMRRLQQADLVIWIDRHFEDGFSRVPDFLRPATQQLELKPALGIDNSDGHIWYSPQLLIRSIEIIVDTLESLNPEYREQYQANAKKLIQDISFWRQEMLHRWQNQRPRYVTDHNFTRYFEQDTGLGAIATVHDQHHDQGGLQNLNQLDRKLQQFPAKCLLTLHTTASPLARSLAQQYDLKIVSVAQEPTANPGQPLIIQRLTQLTTALQKCI